MKKYLGIDFANKGNNVGRCVLNVDVDRKTLTADLQNGSDVNFDGIAIDCPFGTTVGFFNLLQGKDAGSCDWDLGLKTRHTEHALRNLLWSYDTRKFWGSQDVREPQFYVNKTAHVQPTVGLVIVPDFLNWLRCDQKLTSEQLVNARLGFGRWVESHPRAFLYSIIERIYRKHSTDQNIDWICELKKTVTYKDKRTVSHVSERTNVAEFLRRYASAWLWYEYVLDALPSDLLSTDHAFDAFLASLTGFACQSNQIVSYGEAKIPKDTVEIEGHIPVLIQTLPSCFSESSSE